MFCPNCGNRNDENASFCLNCGANLKVVSPQLNQINNNQILTNNVNNSINDNLAKKIIKVQTK